MTAHNDKIEAVARAIAEADGQMWEGLSLQYAYVTYITQAEAVLTLMEERGWLKADASRSVSSAAPAGREEIATAGMIISDLFTASFTHSLATESITIEEIERRFSSWHTDALEWLDRNWTDFPIDAWAAIFVKRYRAARSESEDTQQAEGAANPANPLQELIEAAEDVAGWRDDSMTSIEQTELSKLRAALQNVRESDK